MSIKIAITGSPPIVVNENEVTLGSAPSCTIAFLNHPEIKPKHAVIRLLAGRWLVEAREGDAIFVGSSEPKRLQWLKPNDIVMLSPTGPSVIFQPDENGPSVSASFNHVSMAAPRSSSDFILNVPSARADSSSPFKSSKTMPDSISLAPTREIPIPRLKSDSWDEDVPTIYPPGESPESDEISSAKDSTYGFRVQKFETTTPKTIPGIDEPGSETEIMAPVVLPRISLDAFQQVETVPLSEGSQELQEPGIDPDVVWMWMVIMKIALAGIVAFIFWMGIRELTG